MSGIAVLGSASGDLVVQQPRLPLVGETLMGTTFTTVSGGKGLNQAIAAARAGGDVAFVGAVGDDEHGRMARAALAGAGVRIEGMTVLQEVPTGTAHIAVLEGGDNAIVIVPGANSAVDRLSDDDRELIASARFLVAQLERPLGLVTEALAFAHDRGVRTVLTPAPVVPLGRELLATVDFLVANSVEARQLSGAEDERAAAAALSLVVGTVLLTLGESGSLLARDGTIVRETAARRVEAVDTTAAGDTFAGVLVAWLAAGAGIEDAVDAATAAASVCVTRLGASPSVPTREEILLALDTWPEELRRP